MKKLITFIVVVVVALLSVNAQEVAIPAGDVNTNSTYVKGYTRADGTYVKGHYRSKPNNTNRDNWSTSGNTNINTGASGSRAKDYSSEAYNYGGGRTIHTGPRGGQYYINSKGRKVYVPKRR